MCVGGLWGGFLNVLLLLKIIVTIKNCYVGDLCNMEGCINVASVFFKVVKNLKMLMQMNWTSFP